MIIWHGSGDTISPATRYGRRLIARPNHCLAQWVPEMFGHRGSALLREVVTGGEIARGSQTMQNAPQESEIAA